MVLQMNTQTKKLLIASGMLLALLHVTILFMVIPAISSRLTTSFNQEGYPDGYDQLAANLVAGHGYRFYPETALTVMREPGYPFLLAGLFLAFGPSFAVMKFCNLLFAFATAWMMVPIARRIIPDGQWREVPLYLLPSLFFLIHPGTLLAECRGGLEIIFAFLIVSFMRTALYAVETSSTLAYASAGLILGVTVLIRSTPILFSIFLLAYLLTMRQTLRSRVATVFRIGVMIIAMFFVLSPWIIRNFRLTGKFMPTTSVFGVSAQAGEYINEHLFDGKPMWILDREASRVRDKFALDSGYAFEDGPQGYYQTFYKTSDEIAFSHYLAELTLAKYKEHPLLFARCLGQNLFNFWFSGKTFTATALDVAVQLPYLLLALVGVIRSSKNENAKTVRILVLFVGYLMLIHAPILAQARYSIPLVPFLSVLAVSGIVSIAQKMSNGKGSVVPNYASA
jgi:hypothetical protein